MTDQTIKDEPESLFIKNREEARRFDNAISKLMPNTFPPDTEKDRKLKELKFNYVYTRTMFAVEDAIGDQARRLAIAHLVDGLDVVRGPFVAPCLQFLEEPVLRQTRRHQNDAVALQRHLDKRRRIFVGQLRRNDANRALYVGLCGGQQGRIDVDDHLAEHSGGKESQRRSKNVTF